MPTITLNFEMLTSAPAPATCEELGRVTRAYVSGYDRTRVLRSDLVRGERRCLVANFNGAIPLGRSIVSATWRTNENYAVLMSGARIDGRETMVMIDAGWGSPACVKCEVTLDNGERYNQLFVIRVLMSPWFEGESASGSGPQVLVVEA